MTDREKALEAFENIATALQAECGYSKWFPDWVKAPQYPMMFTRENYKVALDEIRYALSAPSFEDAVKVVEEMIADYEMEETPQGAIKRRVIYDILTALRERGKGK